MTNISDCPNLVYTGADPAVLFYDPDDPMEQAIQFVKKTAIYDARFIILLGFGLGYPALELLRQNHRLKKIIIIEKDPACLKHAMKVIDLEKVIDNPQISLIVGCPESDLYMSFHQAVNPNFIALKDARILPWPASLHIARTYYSHAMKAISDVTDVWLAGRGNDPYDTLVAYEQFFLNIETYFNSPGAKYVKGFFKEKPAIIVATGPSLKKSLHLLKEAENSAVIVSADASFRILHNGGIYPHFTTTVERTPGPAMFYEGLDDLEKTVLAVISFAHPSTLAAFKGPKLLFHRIYNFMKKLDLSEDSIQMGLSTANMGYEVARHMGCNPIILVGNDLAFDSTGNTHAPGFMHGERQDTFQDMDRFDVPGNYEATVTTCHDWFKCIKEYEKRIADWEGTLINATAGGAKIQGSIVMPLKEVLNTYCATPFYPRDMIRQSFSLYQSQHSSTAMLSQISEFIGHADWGIDMSKKMLAVLRSIVSEIGASGAKFPSLLSKDIQAVLSHTNSVLDNLDGTYLIGIFSEYFCTEIIPLLMEWQVINYRFNDPMWADAYRLKLAEDFFGAMGQLCVSLKEVLLDGQKRLTVLQSQRRVSSLQM